MRPDVAAFNEAPEASSQSSTPTVLAESDPAVPLEARPGDAALCRLPSGVAASRERGLEAGLAPTTESGVRLALSSPSGTTVASGLSMRRLPVTAVGDMALRRGL